jgi:hypothetical protein
VVPLGYRSSEEADDDADGAAEDAGPAPGAHRYTNTHTYIESAMQRHEHIYTRRGMHPHIHTGAYIHIHKAPSSSRRGAIDVGKRSGS